MEMTTQLLAFYAFRDNFQFTTLNVPGDVSRDYLNQKINQLNIRYIWIVADINNTGSLSTLLREIVKSNNVKKLLIPDIADESTDSNQEEKFAQFFLKSGNFGENIVPQNDGVFLYCDNKLLITIGKPLSGTKIVEDLLNKITQEKIDFTYFPIIFNQRLKQECVLNIDNWYRQIERLHSKVIINGDSQDMLSKICIFFMGHTHSKIQPEITDIKLLEDPMKYYRQSVELHDYVSAEEKYLIEYCEKNKLSYVPNQNLIHLEENYRLIRLLLTDIYNVKHRVWYRSQFFVFLGAHLSSYLCQFLYAVVTDKPTGSKLLELGIISISNLVILILWVFFTGS